MASVRPAIKIVTTADFTTEIHCAQWSTSVPHINMSVVALVQMLNCNWSAGKQTSLTTRLWLLYQHCAVHVIRTMTGRDKNVIRRRDHTSNNCGIDWLAKYAFASSSDIFNTLRLWSHYRQPVWNHASTTLSPTSYYCRYHGDLHHAPWLLSLWPQPPRPQPSRWPEPALCDL